MADEKKKDSSRSEQVMALLGFGLAAWLVWGLWQGRYPSIWGVANDGPPGGVRQVGWLGPHFSPIPFAYFPPYGAVNTAYPVGVTLDGLNPGLDSGQRPVSIEVVPDRGYAEAYPMVDTARIAPVLDGVVPQLPPLPQPESDPIPPS